MWLLYRCRGENMLYLLSTHGGTQTDLCCEDNGDQTRGGLEATGMARFCSAAGNQELSLVSNVTSVI